MEWLSFLYTVRITLECAGVLRCPSGPVHQLSDQTDRLWARLKEVCPWHYRLIFACREMAFIWMSVCR